jgi:hypothetical protein
MLSKQNVKKIKVSEPQFLDELYYLSIDDEFNANRHALEPKKDKISAASANETKDVIGVPHFEEKVFTEECYLNNKKNRSITKYTVKKGHTIGNTLAEIAAQIRLNKIREANPLYHSIEDKKEADDNKDDDVKYSADEKEIKDIKPIQDITTNSRYAKSFFVTQVEFAGQTYATAESFIKNLYAASRWQPNVAYAVNACKLFGFKKRPKPAAATFHPELFEDLRELNERCELGLDEVFHATALTADLDFHTDNYLLNFDISMLEGEQKERAAQLIKQFDALFHKEGSKKVKPINNRKNHLDAMVDIIESIKKLEEGNKRPVIYFHKIDHDSGLYRFCDNKREVSLRDHGTSMTSLQFVGGRPHLRMQPTNHLAELLVGKASDSFILSGSSIDAVMANSIPQQVNDSQYAMDIFFNTIQQQCQMSVHNEYEKARAELILLKHFQQHIVSGSHVSIEVSKPPLIELKKQIRDTKKDIQKNITEATIARGIALHREYLDFIQESKITKELKQVHAFKHFLEKDKESAVFLKIQLHKDEIAAEFSKKTRWFSFMSDAANKRGRVTLANIQAGRQKDVIDFLSHPKNKSHRLYKIISKHIGATSMPLYTKSSFKQFREGLAGLRKQLFWLGLGLIGAVAIGAAITALAVFTGGVAVPVLLPAIGGLIGGVGIGLTTISAATNPATERWYRNTSFLKKLGFVVGVTLFLAAATILTGGAALALVGAISVIAGVAALLGIKAAATISATAAVSVKAATLTAGAVEGTGLAARAIKSATTKKIVRQLGGPQKKEVVSKSDELRSPLLKTSSLESSFSSRSRLTVSSPLHSIPSEPMSPLSGSPSSPLLRRSSR